MKNEPQTTNIDYADLLNRVVTVIENARLAIARTMSNTCTQTYWEVGKLLYERKLDSTHGSSVVKRLSSDLKDRYPDIGTSPRNLWNMKAFYVRYKDSDPKVQRCVALLPWSHNLLLLRKELSDEATIYYASEDVAKGWTSDLLLNAIKLRMHETHPLLPATNNFDSALPSEQAKYAKEVFKSSYNLGFLNVTEPLLELELERRLVERIKLFLLELGKGFTFIGNQHVLEFNGKEYRVDMLFFHRQLRCLVAVDLKIGEYKPEYAGKMNTYLSLLDRLEKGENENRSIGIILCAEKDNVEVALSLEDIGKPIGVAEYQLIIPQDDLKRTIEDEIKSFEEEKRIGHNEE